MTATASIFFEFNLPNPTTWFYFSGLLAIALFFKFTRFLSMRNLDVLTLYLFTPGLLLFAERGPTSFLAYLWLMIACFYFLIRCLFDLTLVRRPALGVNLDSAGLAWLGGALFISLITVAVRLPTSALDRDESARTPIDGLPDLSKKYIQPYAPADVDDSRLRIVAERGLAVLCHLSVVIGLLMIGWFHFDDLQSGMSAATFYLLLPYNFLLLPDSPLGVGRWDHSWAMAFVVWGIFCYRRPVLAGLFLGIGTGTAFYLLVILPVWLSFYRNRGVLRFLITFLLSAGLALGVLGGLLWINGELPAPLQSSWMHFDWQPWKPLPNGVPSFWQEAQGDTVGRIPAVYRVPVFILCMALVILSAFWPAPKNLAHVLALSAASLISVQFWYADQGGVYVLWFLPLLLLLVFRPNLQAMQPPVPSKADWLSRCGRQIHRWAFRYKVAEPV